MVEDSRGVLQEIGKTRSRAIRKGSRKKPVWCTVSLVLTYSLRLFAISCNFGAFQSNLHFGKGPIAPIASNIAPEKYPEDNRECTSNNHGFTAVNEYTDAHIVFWQCCVKLETGVTQNYPEISSSHTWPVPRHLLAFLQGVAA